jgi:hypothetical protein
LNTSLQTQGLALIAAHLLGNRSGFGTLHGSDIDGLGIGIREAEGDGVAVLHEHAGAGGDAGVLEVGVGLLGLCGVQVLGGLHVLVNLGSTNLILGGLSSSGCLLGCHLFLNLNNGQD